MTPSTLPTFDPTLDLRIERVVDAPPEAIWRAWTTPDLLMKWFTPAPWRTIACSIDLRPGGAFHTTMLSPEGEEFPDSGCYLEVAPNERLVWTNALTPGFRPVADSPFVPFPFTAAIVLEPNGAGTKYVATAMHRDASGREQHEKFNFHEGWNAALDQLLTAIKPGG